MILLLWHENNLEVRQGAKLLLVRTYVRTYVYKNHWQKKRDRDIGGIHALGESSGFADIIILSHYPKRRRHDEERRLVTLTKT